jgi:hypothetical protein
LERGAPAEPSVEFWPGRLEFTQRGDEARSRRGWQLRGEKRNHQFPQRLAMPPSFLKVFLALQSALLLAPVCLGVLTMLEDTIHLRLIAIRDLYVGAFEGALDGVHFKPALNLACRHPAES